jgi:hypothetical protein
MQLKLARHKIDPFMLRTPTSLGCPKETRLREAGVAANNHILQRFHVVVHVEAAQHAVSALTGK